MQRKKTYEKPILSPYELESCSIMDVSGGITRNLYNPYQPDGSNDVPIMPDTGLGSNLVTPINGTISDQAGSSTTSLIDFGSDSDAGTGFSMN